VLQQGLQALIDGLLTGGIYAMVGAGLSLVFGVMRVVNFAHGALVALGMYGVLEVSTRTKMDPYVSLVVVLPVAFVVGFVLHRFVLRRLLDAPEQSTLLATLGVGLVVSNGLLLRFGAQPKTVFTESATAAYRLGDYSFSKLRLIAVLVTAVILAVLSLVLKKTALGRAIRATAQNRMGAELQGVDTPRIHAVVFGVGTVLAAAAGGLLLPLLYATPTVGETFTYKAFVVTVLGGMGSLPGAIGGGLLLGVLESVGSSVLPLVPFLHNRFGSNYRDAYGLVAFLLVLLLRPDGLFGKNIKRT